MESQPKKPKIRPSKIEEMTKEQIRQAILKKRECNAKAQGIVENLLQQCVSEEYLIECLPDINQSHFEDIIEERAITHVCGYPICPKQLSLEEIPKQKYRISMRTNKVYDITARKSFCSNHCYQAAMHVKKQMLTSPLWFREYEDIPKLSLLQPSQPASMGQEIDVAIVEKIQQPQAFASVNDFTSASLNDISGESENQDVDMKEKITNQDNDKFMEISSTTKENDKFIEISGKTQEKETSAEMDSIKKSLTSTSKDMKDPELQEIKSRSIEKTPKPTAEIKSDQQEHNKGPSVSTIPFANTETIQTKPQKKVIKNPMNIVGEIFEKPEQKIDPILTDSNITSAYKEKPIKKVLQKKQPLVTALTIEIEKCLAEWFTIDTLLFLFGEENVKLMVADKGDCIKEYLNNYTKGIFYTSNSYDHYQALCRKLNMLELEDKQHDLQTLKKEMKPLPDYTLLQEESKKLQLKVRAFYSGETEMQQLESAEKQPDSEENEQVTHLPLVDKNAQNALRRKVFCQQLNRVLPDLLRSLGLLTLSISSEVHMLVNSFHLKANNITFKPIQWTLIAIVIIKLLSLRDKRLAYLLEQPTAFQHMQLLLLSYKQHGGYLDRLISWLTDIDRLLDTNDVQLTID